MCLRDLYVCKIFGASVYSRSHNVRLYRQRHGEAARRHKKTAGGMLQQRTQQNKREGEREIQKDRETDRQRIYRCRSICALISLRVCSVSRLVRNIAKRPRLLDTSSIAQTRGQRIVNDHEKCA